LFSPLTHVKIPKNQSLVDQSMQNILSINGGKTMRKSSLRSLFLLVSLVAFFVSCATGTSGDASQLESAEPGVIEIKASPEMAQIMAVSQKLDVAEDEAVVYYYRPDGAYEDRGFWLWRFGDGDGSVNWEKSQNLTIDGGVSYFRFKQDGSDVAGDPIVNPAGEFAFIVRNDGGWEDQTPDFVWNVAQKGNEVAFIRGAEGPEAVGEYVPFFEGATMLDSTTIEVMLSGKHALELDAATNGFTITSLDGSQSLEIVDVVNAYSPNNRSYNYTDKIQIKLAEDLPMSRGFAVGHPAYLAVEGLDTSNLVALLADNYVPSTNYELGAIYSNGGVEFRVWTPFANSVSARLFTRPLSQIGKDAPADYLVDLTKNEETGVWIGTFDTVDPDGLFYDYLIDNGKGPVPALDPYARSMDAYVNEGGPGRGAIVNMDRAQPSRGWEGLEDVTLIQREDAIIYEASVRDFTISPDSGVTGKKGTFLAMIQKLDYIADLGVTHLQLLPVYNFYYTNEMNQSYEGHGRTSDSNYNWGYDPHNHFTPEGWYSSNPLDPYSRMNDFKTLIKEAHRRGLGIIMDVVYNHMGSTQLLETVVPNYYFRKNPNGTFTSNSGVGNDFASSRAMARKLIVDNLVHWAEEYNVDGFRFDLMGLIDAETVLAGYEAVSALPGKEDILFQGEGWQMYRWTKEQEMMDQNYMTKTDSVAVFNDEIRNLLKAGGFNEEGKGFLTNKATSKEQIFQNLMGNPQKVYTADDPGDSMLYVAAHDGLTLHDTLAHNAEIDHTTPEGKIEIAARAKLANMLMLTGQGISFLHAGQERGRTKPNVNNVKNETIGQFVRNSYDSADNINQIVWTLEAPFQNLLDYTKGLIALRKSSPAFRIGDAATIANAATYLKQDDPFSFAYKLDYQGETFFIMLNAAEVPSTLDMGRDVSDYRVIADQNTVNLEGIASPEGVSVSGNSITLEGLTAAILTK
jgi:pullulanase